MWSPVTLLFADASLTQDAPQRTGCHLIAGLAGHGDLAGLGGMSVLVMATALGDEVPAILLHEPYDVSDFHVVVDRVMSGPLVEVERIGGLSDGLNAWV
jgi:hypothetical protein